MAGLKETFLKMGDTVYDAAVAAKAKLGIGAKPAPATAKPAAAAPPPSPEEKARELEGSGYIADIGAKVTARKQALDEIQ